MQAAEVLGRAGHEVRLGSTASLHQQVASFRPDLVILDLLQGDVAALRGAVRQTHASYRPLVLCAVEGPDQWVPALEAGADAFVQKPFDDHQLEVSVHALMRRVPWLGRTQQRIGGLVVDVGAHLVLFDEEPLSLSKKEFGILAILAEHPGQVISKRLLLERLWGYEAYDENLVEVHICSLRRRLPRGAADMIRTVRGVGYVLRTLGPAAALQAG